MSKAFRAAFHRLVHRWRPRVPVGSRNPGEFRYRRFTPGQNSTRSAQHRLGSRIIEVADAEPRPGFASRVAYKAPSSVGRRRTTRMITVMAGTGRCSSEGARRGRPVVFLVRCSLPRRMRDQQKMIGENSVALAIATWFAIFGPLVPRYCLIQDGGEMAHRPRPSPPAPPQRHDRSVGVEQRRVAHHSLDRCCCRWQTCSSARLMRFACQCPGARTDQAASAGRSAMLTMPVVRPRRSVVRRVLHSARPVRRHVTSSCAPAGARLPSRSGGRSSRAV